MVEELVSSEALTFRKKKWWAEDLKPFNRPNHTIRKKGLSKSVFCNVKNNQDTMHTCAHMHAQNEQSGPG